MTAIHPSPSLPDHGRENAEGILRQYDSYIQALAQKKIPRHLRKSQDELCLQVDELAQRSRIKLWIALQKHPIESPKAYIKIIVHSELIDLIRCEKPHHSITTDEYGEIIQGIILAASEETKDPEVILDQRETWSEKITKVIEAILLLPKRQKLATLCRLKEKIDDIEELVDILGQYDINIQDIHWPKEKKERQLLQASFAPARRSIAQYIGTDL